MANFIKLFFLIIVVSATLQSFTNHNELSNSAFRLSVNIEKSDVHVKLEEKQMPLKLSEGNYIYRAQISGAKDTLLSIQNPKVTVSGQHLTIHGTIAGVDVEQNYFLPEDKPYMEEHIVLHNPNKTKIAFSEFEIGFPLIIKDKDNKVFSEFANDRLIAVPFRHRPDDRKGEINDFAMSDILEKQGWEYRPNARLTEKLIFQSRHHFSEAWTWIHKDRSIGVFSFNQENMTFSVLSPVMADNAKVLRFGGVCYLPIFAQPTALGRINPGDTVDLGITRYQSINGDYNEVAYSYRNLLDEKNCRFPKNFNPPIHWEQLYDMNKAWVNRSKDYTKSRIELEAAKGVEYSCEALYLDPGWDTEFGSFIWGEKWLGPRKEFIENIKSKYGLLVSLHTPMPPWTSAIPEGEWGPISVSGWPEKSRRIPDPKLLSDTLGKGPAICMGSKAFMDEAEKRLLDNCKDGVCYLMYDGTGWNGACIDSTHGHPVPYLQEDFMRNCIELVKRVHSKYPNVLIELHDLLDGPTEHRMTPVYYKYGLPLSYDENWGFEMMWNAMEIIKNGPGLSMYYYNLACNVPIYLHINLSQDNEHCLMLWWFASTVRHLGIGGTNKNPKIIEAEKAAMKYYRKFDRFYKRGDFYGINEEIHLHVLTEENAFMVNMFNLSDKLRTIKGTFDLKRARLNPSLSYIISKPWAKIVDGKLEVSLEMPAWSAEVANILGKTN